MRRCVTVWFRKTRQPNGTDKYVMNHIEDGHIAMPKPTVKHPDQGGWNRSEWQREHAFLSEDVPPKLVSRFTIASSLDTIPL